jgi:hypothetical protein
MRIPPVAISLVVMALPILSHAVGAEPANDAITRLRSCFQLDRVDQVECLEKLSRELPDRNVQSSVQQAEGSWVISETTSPVDYSPMVTAATLSQSNAKDAPTTFAIRCRGQRTDLLVSTEGSWRASRVNELQVDCRINDQSKVRMQWIASTDGRTAIFKDDAVRFLRSLPDGGRITVSVFDWQGPEHAATFQLTGLDAIRQKIGVACKWAPAADRVSPAKR